MPISPICDKCKEELVVPGALVFSPPVDNMTHKFHICATCYKSLLEFINLKKK